MCACVCVCIYLNTKSLKPFCGLLFEYKTVGNTPHTDTHRHTHAHTHTLTPDTPWVDDKQKIHFTQTLVLFKSEIHIHGRRDRRTGGQADNRRHTAQGTTFAPGSGRGMCCSPVCAASLLSLLTFHALLSVGRLNIYHTLNILGDSIVNYWISPINHGKLWNMPVINQWNVFRKRGYNLSVGVLYLSCN